MTAENSYCCECESKKHIVLTLMLIAVGAASIIYLKSRLGNCSETYDDCECCLSRSASDSDNPGELGE